jgi:hypothetical protein
VSTRRAASARQILGLAQPQERNVARPSAAWRANTQRAAGAARLALKLAAGQQLGQRTTQRSVQRLQRRRRDADLLLRRVLVACAAVQWT